MYRDQEPSSTTGLGLGSELKPKPETLNPYNLKPLKATSLEMYLEETLLAG